MKTEYIVGIGELLWDVLPDGRRLGGAPANFAYHVSQFGLKSVVVSAVGRDEAGDAAVRELEAMSAHPFPDSESDRSDGSWYSAESSGIKAADEIRAASEIGDIMACFRRILYLD